jgi:addiction module HigA family antidote
MTNYQKIKPIHPGEILREEFLVSLKLSVEQLAQDINFSLEECQKVVNEQEDFSLDLIYRLSAYFDLLVEFW